MAYKYTSGDGLAKSNDKALIENWNSIIAKSKQDEQDWVDMLLSSGIKAAHPDDGWVDRENNSIHFVYPQFFTDLNVGDEVALGKVSI